MNDREEWRGRFRVIRTDGTTRWWWLTIQVIYLRTVRYRNSSISNKSVKHKKVKLVTIFEGDPKAPFSIATALKCRGGCYSFPWIALLYPWYVPYIADVVYWPMTRLGCQNRKCTYVNNRCIRSRNIRIITLTVDELNECNCDAHKKVGVELLYNSVLTGSQLVWRPDQLEIRCGRESQHPAEWAPRPPVEQPRRMGKKRSYGQ